MSSKKIKKIEKKREDIRRYLYCNYPIYHLQIPLKANPQSLLKTLGLLKHWILGQPGRNVQSHSLNILCISFVGHRKMIIAILVLYLSLN